MVKKEKLLTKQKQLVFLSRSDDWRYIYMNELNAGLPNKLLELSYTRQQVLVNGDLITCNVNSYRVVRLKVTSPRTLPPPVPIFFWRG